MFNDTVLQTSDTVSKILTVMPDHYKLAGENIDYSFVNTFGLIFGERKPEENFLVESGQYIQNDDNEVPDVKSVLARLYAVKELNPNDSIIYIAYRYSDGYHYNDKIPFYQKAEDYPIFLAENIPPADDNEELKDLYYTDNWEELSDINAFYSSCFPCRVMINQKHKISLIFAHLLSRKVAHALQGSISRQFPMHFAEKPFDKSTGSLEYKYVDSLTKSNLATYAAAADSLFKQSKLHEIYYDKMLANLFARMSQKRCETIQANLDSIEREIEELYESIYSRNSTVYDLKLRLKGLKAGEDEDSKFLKDYLVANKDVEYVSNDDSTITFDIENYLSTWMEETAEADCTNQRSEMWDMIAKHTKADMMKLMSAIFVDKKYRIRLKHRFIFDLISGRPSLNSPDLGKDSHLLHNPHLAYHNCLGGYKEPITRSIKEGNMLNAIEYAKSAVGSINISEAISSKYLVRELDSCARKVLMKEDGTWITVNDALEELR